jgi:hypothetical protein
MLKRNVCKSCGRANASSKEFCGDCGKSLTEAAPGDKPGVAILDAKALDAIGKLEPPSAPVDEGSYADMTLPLFPDEEVVSEPAVLSDPPTTHFIPGIISPDIVVTCTQGANAGTGSLLRDGNSVLVGASEEAGLRLTGDDYVSRAHVTIVRSGDDVIVKDSSTNGTYVRVEGETTVPVGSVLLVGRHLLHIGWDM